MEDDVLASKILKRGRCDKDGSTVRMTFIFLKLVPYVEQCCKTRWEKQGWMEHSKPAVKHSENLIKTVAVL